MRRKFKYTFTRKEETEGGFSSLIFAGCSLLLFLVSACLSFFWERKAESWIGALGLMAVLFSVSGFVIGMKSFKEKGKNYRFSVMGAMANGVISVGWLALILIGL